jgi:tetratricopeptide (TPR) repeat protein
MPEESLEEKMRITKKIRESLVKAEEAVKKNKLEEAAIQYKAAAELAEGLGHHQIAQDYLKKASDLKPVGNVEIEPEVLSQDPGNKFMELAQKAVSAGSFGEAAKIYEEAARKIPANSEKLLKEAMDLRNREKEIYITKKELQRKTDSMQDYELVLGQIKDALQKNQYQELVSLYGRAAVLAEKLGRRNEAGEYRKAAIDAKRKVISEMKDTKEGRVQLVKQYTEILQQIKQFLDEKKWNQAAEKYMEAAKLAYDMEEFERAKLYKEKAAELKNQAQGLEKEINLKEKRLNRLKEIKSLDLEKDNEQILANYAEILKTYEELKDKEALDEVQKNFKKAEKIGERKKSLIEANDAMEQGNHIKALEHFQRALRISIEVNEQTKAEGFKKIIDELKNKVDKVARNRMMIEQRAELLGRTKSALKEAAPNIPRIAEDYKEAARISFELGENDLAQSYLETAKRVESNKDLIIERENFIKEAEAALKEKKFMMASNFFQQVAKFSDKLGEHELAEKYGKKAKALKDLAEEL